MNKTPTIIVTVKNRLEHFYKTFPFYVTQVGVDYRLMYVNYDSEDNFETHLLTEIEKKKDTFSKNLKQIIQVKLEKPSKFDVRKSKNLGVAYAQNYSDLFVFSDNDALLGMGYLNKWVPFVKRNKTFVTNRVQESRAALPRRITPPVNYGNIIIHSEDYLNVSGFDESMTGWGGDDDDLFHRLKLNGLREINPYDENEACQYSILHDDELRFACIENPSDPREKDLDAAFKSIYSNTNTISKESNYLNTDFIKNISNEKVLYEHE